MGCTSSSTVDPYANSLPPKVDPRLPFHTYRQVFTVKNTWKAVQRKMDETARFCLIGFLNKHTQYKPMYPELDDVNSWSEEKLEDSLALRNASLDLFNVIDEVLATLETVDGHAVDTAMTLAYQEGIRLGGVQGVDKDYYTNMEEPLIASIRETLGDRFTENQETNMRLLYDFMRHYMTAGAEKTLKERGILNNNQEKSENGDKKSENEDKKSDKEENPEEENGEVNVEEKKSENDKDKSESADESESHTESGSSSSAESESSQKEKKGKNGDIVKKDKK